MLSTARSRWKQRLGRQAVWTVVALTVLAATGVSFWLRSVPADDSERADFLRRYEGGSLVIAGGGPLPTEIRQRFLELANGPNHARLVVIPAFDASTAQQEDLKKFWHGFGVENVQVLHAHSRDQANQESFSKVLDQATGVWLSGGVQAWLSAQYADTIVEEKLRGVVARGGVIGGSSAGAAVMTKVMIEQGQEDATEGIGFDLLSGAVIDQHFLRRSRVNRLVRVMESHPDLMAFGIDEGTALVVQVPKGRLGVIGTSYVLAYVPLTNNGKSRFEILKSGDQIEMNGLKTGVRVSSPLDINSLVSD